MKGEEQIKDAAEEESTSIEKEIGESTLPESFLKTFVGNAIHIFFALLAVVILVAAAIAAYQTLAHEFPRFFAPASEYDVLQRIIENILLIAIAGELCLLLLFHRTSAAVEVVIFVIARKIISPEITSLDLLLSVVALGGLLVVRYYYLPGKPK